MNAPHRATYGPLGHLRPARRLNLDRAALYQLAEYYAWAARRGFGAPGNDPRTGEPWNNWRQLDRTLGRAMHSAAARVCYAAARTYPNPLPR